jgi:hypothetical protein
MDALLSGEPGALDDRELRAHLQKLMEVRAQVDAAMVAATLELDQRNAYMADGAVDARAWLAHHTAVSRKTAGALVWLAKHVRYMPAFAEALAAGLITCDHVRVMATAINPRTLEPFMRDEALLLRHAIALEADDFAHAVARWKFLADPDGPGQGNERPSEWHVSSMLDGRHRVDGEFDLEDSVEYLAELEARYEEIWQRDHGPDATDEERNRTASQRYAAAQLEMARRSSMAGDPEVDDGTPVTIRTTARKTQIIVVCDAEAAAGDPSARAELEDGTPVPQHVLQRWLCDSAVGRVVMNASSVPIDVGRLAYSASDAQRRALIARDGGCVVPGCKRKPRWCEVHHVVWWENGGPTDLANLALGCNRHHKQIHQGIINVIPGDKPGTFIVTRADGTLIRERPPPSEVAA